MSTQFQEPRIVSIHHDGVEVARITDGVTQQLPPGNQQPKLLQIYWDGTLVYELHTDTGQVTVNQMVPKIEATFIEQPVPA